MCHYSDAVSVAASSLNQRALDFTGNLRRIKASLREAKRCRASVRTGPELEITGYDCGDHFFEWDTLEHAWQVLTQLLDYTRDWDMLCDFGMPVAPNHPSPCPVYNCRVLTYRGQIVLVRPKMAMANDSWYHESRWFTPWAPGVMSVLHVHSEVLARAPHDRPHPRVVPFGDAVIVSADGVRIAFETCEELWAPMPVHLRASAHAGAHVVINSSASHFALDKLATRASLVTAASARSRAVYVYTNALGCAAGARAYFDGTPFAVFRQNAIAVGHPCTLRDHETVIAKFRIWEIAAARAGHNSAAVQTSAAIVAASGASNPTSSLSSYTTRTNQVHTSLTQNQLGVTRHINSFDSSACIHDQQSPYPCVHLPAGANLCRNISDLEAELPGHQQAQHARAQNENRPRHSSASSGQFSTGSKSQQGTPTLDLFALGLDGGQGPGIAANAKAGDKDECGNIRTCSSNDSVASVVSATAFISNTVVAASAYHGNPVDLSDESENEDFPICGAEPTSAEEKDSNDETGDSAVSDIAEAAKPCTTTTTTTLTATHAADLAPVPASVSNFNKRYSTLSSSWCRECNGFIDNTEASDDEEVVGDEDDDGFGVCSEEDDQRRSCRRWRRWCARCRHVRSHEDGDALTRLSAENPGSQLARAASAWLWDYLARTPNCTGFALALSGGLDSSTVAVLVRVMCERVARAARSMPDLPEKSKNSATSGAINDVEFDDYADDFESLREVLSRIGLVPEKNGAQITADDLMARLLHTVYMPSEHSTAASRNRAHALASAIGAQHYQAPIVDAVTALVVAVSQALAFATVPSFSKNSVETSWAVDLALQNVQARVRMVLVYLFAQMVTLISVLRGAGKPKSKRSSSYADFKPKNNKSFLLVLGASNAHETLRGYLTKYDCSAADINPIGSLGKQHLRSIMQWYRQNLILRTEKVIKRDRRISSGTPIGISAPVTAAVAAGTRALCAAISAVLDAAPSAELRPTPQSDEIDMGVTYTQLARFARARCARLGPYGMFLDMLQSQTLGPKLPPRKCAETVKKMFEFYAQNRHKTPVLPPSPLLATCSSTDDARFDMRPVLYPDLSWQFSQIDRHVEKLEKKFRQQQQQHQQHQQQQLQKQN